MPQKDQNISIDINQTDPIVCDDCGNDTFLEVFYMRKVSAVIAGEESIIPIPVFECARCGHINKVFEPK